MKRLTLIALLLLLPLAAAPARAGEITALAPADVAELLAPPAQGVRVIMLWALYCHYCEPNMATLAQWRAEQAGPAELILVSTDPIAQRTALEARLAAAGMQDQAARAYSESSPERLNFLLDPNWGGELPRTLVIHADGHRAAVSGKLGEAQLQKLGLPACRACAAAGT